MRKQIGKITSRSNSLKKVRNNSIKLTNSRFKQELIQNIFTEKKVMKRNGSIGQIYSTSGNKNYQKFNNNNYGYHKFDLFQNTMKNDYRNKYSYLSDFTATQPLQNNFKLIYGEYYADNFESKPILCEKSWNTNVKIQKKQNKMEQKQGKQNTNIQKVFGKIKVDHSAQKKELQMKLQTIISNYEQKNKQLSKQMNKICHPLKQDKQNKQKEYISYSIKSSQQKINPIQQNLANDIYNKLKQKVQLKRQMNKDKIQTLWKHLFNQILLEDQVRIIKTFINIQNVDAIMQIVNKTRRNKIEKDKFILSSQQYDPMQVQYFQQILTSRNTQSISTGWIANMFSKVYDEALKHWVKYFSNQQLQFMIRELQIQHEMNKKKKPQTSIMLPIRDFTRLLSLLFKTNIRIRHLFQIYKKLKTSPLSGRLIWLLQQRTIQIKAKCNNN